jgi:hypothetical protein
MLFLLASLAAAAGATPTIVRSPAPAAKPVRSCMPQGVTFAQQTARSHGLRRLGEEPPANEYLAVDRNVGGCPAPAVVRTRIVR